MVAFSDDDRWIALGSKYGGGVAMWDLSAYAEAKRDGTSIDPPQDVDFGEQRVSQLEFLPESNELLVVGGQARVWSVERPNSQPYSFLGRQLPPEGFHVNPRRNWLLTTEPNRPAWLWTLGDKTPLDGDSVTTEQLLGYAAQIAGRNLTHKEWDRHLAPTHLYPTHQITFPSIPSDNATS